MSSGTQRLPTGVLTQLFVLSRPSEPRSGLCCKEAQVLPEDGGKWAKASRKSEGEQGVGRGRRGVF